MVFPQIEHYYMQTLFVFLKNNAVFFVNIFLLLQLWPLGSSLAKQHKISLDNTFLLFL